MLRTPLCTAVRSLVAALAFVGSAHAAAPFTLWVTETPAGGSSQYNSQLKGGVRSYVFDGLGYAAGNVSAGPTIAASGLNDPSSLTVDSAGSLLIADRGFNTGSGAVSRVTFTGFVPNAPTTVLSSIDTGPHQIALTASGGLIVSSLGNGGKLYPGVAAPATVSYNSGAERGAVVNGSLLYSTSGGGNLQTFDIGTGSLLGTLGISGAAGLHYGTYFGGSLWLADIGQPGGSGGGVYKVSLDGNGNPTASAKVANVDGAIALAFSPAGDELLVAAHYGGTLTGFAVGAGGTVNASANFSLDGGTLANWGGAHVQFGGMAITSAVPEPAGLALMLSGLLAVAGVHRRRQGLDAAVRTAAR
jgi:hypothetical protein